MMADVLDYNPASLNAAVLPLTFETDVNRPVVPTWFSVYEAAASLSRDLHAHGKLLMANAVPWRFTMFGSVLDIMGTETNVFDQNGVWRPESDEIMNLRRTIAYRKPYLLLLNTDFTKATHAGISLYFQRCLFYDVYPSMFSVNASDQPYWQNAALYNRDRSLFEEYIPLIQQLSAAGWEPITDAHTDNGSIWIERYGANMFTVLNPTATPVQSNVQIDIQSLFPNAKSTTDHVTVRDALTNQILASMPFQPTVSLPLTIEPSETRVVSLRVLYSNHANIQ
jgi:hypothetical protein